MCSFHFLRINNFPFLYDIYPHFNHIKISFNLLVKDNIIRTYLYTSRCTLVIHFSIHQLYERRFLNFIQKDNFNLKHNISLFQNQILYDINNLKPGLGVGVI